LATKRKLTTSGVKRARPTGIKGVKRAAEVKGTAATGSAHVRDVKDAKDAKRVKAAKAVKSPTRRSKDERQQQNEDSARTLAMAIAGIGLEHKALNVEIIDVRGKVDYSDYVVVMSGRSDRQVNALGRHIEEDLQKERHSRCLGVEGMPSGTWLLMDYGDVIVHIFHEDTRGYYDLETLWIDAARVATGSSAQ
jgi:ribosome-associated protein